jgi:carbon storage regulator
MLVLSRYRDESIYIGDDIVITVVDIRGDRVRIGVHAPSDVSVHRQEVYEAIKNGNSREAGAGVSKTDQSPSAPKLPSAPLSQELNKRKAKMTEGVGGLPVSIDTPAEFGGLASDDSAVLPQ